MQYGKPYTYFLKKPGGTTNLLYGSLMLLSTAVVPFLGQIVMLGYQSEVGEDLERDPDLADYSDFDFNRFIQYLTRGLWPFVALLVIGLVVAGLVFLAIGIGFAAGYLTQEWVVGVIVGGVLIVPLSLIGTMLQWPVLLHTQLSREFRFGHVVRFTSSFVRKVGGQLFVSLLVHTLISIPLSLVGLLLCLIGIYPAAAIQLMAQEHYMIQLYRLYLDEGGEPIGGPLEQPELDEA
jgi:hypothetical protein